MPPSTLITIYYFAGNEVAAHHLFDSFRNITGLLHPKLHLLELEKAEPERLQHGLAVLMLGIGERKSLYNECIDRLIKQHEILILALVKGNREQNPSVRWPAVVINYGYNPRGVTDLAYDILGFLAREGALRPVKFGEVDLNDLGKALGDLDLPTYVIKRLEGAEITRVGDLADRTEAEILRIPLIGRETLLLLRGRLAALGLRFGMDLPDWRSAAGSEAEGDLPAARLARVQQEPLGARFEAESENLVIDDAGAATDDQAAKSAIVEQLHREVTRKTKDLQPALIRLDNQLGWHGIARACERLTRCLDRDTLELPAHLGALYSASLEMGSFLDLDRNVREDSSASALPLELELRRPLEDLVRTLAPWLRSFPSIRELDDQLSQFTAPNPLIAPAGEVIGRASDANLVRNEDYQLLLGLVEAAGRGRVQGSKASHRGVLSARNLIIATAKVLSVLSLGALSSDIATRSVLVQRTGTFLMSAERPIMEVISGLPSDVQLAVEALLRDAKGPTPLVPKQPKPATLEAQPTPRRRREQE